MCIEYFPILTQQELSYPPPIEVSGMGLKLSKSRYLFDISKCVNYYQIWPKTLYIWRDSREIGCWFPSCSHNQPIFCEKFIYFKWICECVPANVLQLTLHDRHTKTLFQIFLLLSYGIEHFFLFFLVYGCENLKLYVSKFCNDKKVFSKHCLWKFDVQNNLSFAMSCTRLLSIP